MSEVSEYAYNMWILVILNIAIFLLFIVGFLKRKGNLEWRNMGVVSAFFVALFVEMYGFPLTIYLLTGWLGEAYPVLQPFSHKFGHLWVVVFGGSDIAWALVMGLSIVLIVLGYILLSKAWRQIHVAKGTLVTDGMYAYARHPQYTGLFLIIIGFLIQWPTFLTVLMAPVLIYAYRHLARVEEQRALSDFGDAYRKYMKRTPMFFPALREWKSFITVKISEEQR